MEKIKLFFNKIGWRTVVIILIGLAFQCGLYLLAGKITRNMDAYDFTIVGFDDKIAFVTVFIVPYVVSYAWWYLTPFLISYYNNARFKNLMLTWIICSVVCFVIYILVPTTIARPEGFDGSGNIFNKLTYWIFASDGGDATRCLFPSMHCLLSILCYIGVRGQKNIKLYKRLCFLGMAIIICLSTQLIKQHYIVDLLAAIVLAEGVWFLVNKFNLGRVFDKIFPKKSNTPQNDGLEVKVD